MHPGKPSSGPSADFDFLTVSEGDDSRLFPVPGAVALQQIFCDQPG
jgi:hypothetical protein